MRPCILSLVLLCATTLVFQSKADDEPSPELKALITKFRQDLKSKTPQVRASAYATVAELGDKAKSERRAMCEGMLDNAPIVRTAAADCLKKIDEQTYKVAIALAINKDSETIGEAQKLGKEGAPLIPLILKIAGDISPAASNAKNKSLGAQAKLRHCVYALCAIDPDDTSVNQAVLRMLSNPVPEMRSAAVDNISKLKNKKLGLNGLATIAASTQDAISTRTYAIGMMPELTDVNTEASAKKVLESLRFDKEPKVREAVESALKKFK